MSRFKSENFSRITCEDCGEVTTVEPGFTFNKLNCKCDTEKHIPLNTELDYTNKDGKLFTTIGMFKNGDYEVSANNDLDNTYRVPKATFESDFELVKPTVTLSIEDLKNKTLEEIKDTYNMNELRVLAKVVKIRGASNMGEEKLIGKLLAKVE